MYQHGTCDNISLCLDLCLGTLESQSQCNVHCSFTNAPGSCNTRSQLLTVVTASAKTRCSLCMVNAQGLLGPDPKTVVDLLEAVWSGCASQTPGKGREAAASAFTECQSWVLMQVSKCFYPPLPVLGVTVHSPSDCTQFKHTCSFCMANTWKPSLSIALCLNGYHPRTRNQKTSNRPFFDIYTKHFVLTYRLKKG